MSRCTTPDQTLLLSFAKSIGCISFISVSVRYNKLLHLSLNNQKKLKFNLTAPYVSKLRFFSKVLFAFVLGGKLCIVRNLDSVFLTEHKVILATIMSLGKSYKIDQFLPKFL